LAPPSPTRETAEIIIMSTPPEKPPVIPQRLSLLLFLFSGIVMEGNGYLRGWCDVPTGSLIGTVPMIFQVLIVLYAFLAVIGLFRFSIWGIGWFVVVGTGIAGFASHFGLISRKADTVSCLLLLLVGLLVYMAEETFGFRVIKPRAATV
jgi:hypothetical protein